MIVFERFERSKLSRFVDRYGKPYTFERPILNEYKEPIDALSKVCDIVGVYHESSYARLVEDKSNAGRYVAEIAPMILCMKNDASDLLKIGDVVFANNKRMEIMKVKDLNDAGFAYDISLRYIDNGGTA